MSTVPVLFPGPFDWAAAWFRDYNSRWDALCRGWISQIRKLSSSATTHSSQDIAVDRINRMQILLYRGYVRRQRLKTLHSRAQETRRFVQWMARYSGNFRKLLDVYPEWLGQFDDPSCCRAKLMRTIAFHLYQ